MFDSERILRDQAKQVTRRLFLIGAAATAAYVAMSKLSKSHVEASETVHGTPGEVTLVNFSDDGKNLGKQTVPKLLKSDREWLQQIGKNSFQIARQADTEMPYTGVSWHEHGHGIFRCVCCGTALFSSQTKFESGTGWPSFWAADRKRKRRRTERRLAGNGPHRGPLRSLRGPPRPRLQ